MNILIGFIRIISGLLFIFSGLVKAIDPRGLAYKMQEFFEAWSHSGFLPGLMKWLNDYALAFSIIMIVIEVAVGVALLTGWKKKFTAWLLLLLILFFTFLTSYVLFSGKIKACGCFGDCIPLTPIQTFTKDIILFIFAVLILLNLKYIKPVFNKTLNALVVIAAILLTIILQFYVLKYLPIVDCLPYKKGNNILELRKMPPGAVQDEYAYSFVYEKNGEKRSFSMDALPDSSWDFVDREQKLVKKGINNIPLINDFSLSRLDGTEVTEAILNSPGKYTMFFIKEIPGNNAWVNKYKAYYAKAKAGGEKVYVVTSQGTTLKNYFDSNKIVADEFLTSDATAIKTAARVNPTVFQMEGPVVINKFSWAKLPG